MTDHEKGIETEVKMSSRLVAKKISQDGTDAIRVEDDSGRSIAADQSASGALSRNTRAASRQNEAGTLAVCQVLVQALNEQGAPWAEPQQTTGREQGVDCVAQSANGRTLLVQVTRPAKHSFWHNLARLGRAREESSVREAAERLIGAIRKKAKKASTRDRALITLALDVTDTPDLGFHAVVSELRAKFGSEIDSYGFAAIWVVGELPSLTMRVDAGASSEPA